MTPARRGVALRGLYFAGLLLWCLVSFLLSCLSDPAESLGVDLHVNDKVEHATQYGVGGFLAAGAFGGLAGLAPWASGMLFATLWGASDEFHQSFVEGRDADGLDIVADATGGLLGGLAMTWCFRRAQKAPRQADEGRQGESSRRPT